MLFSRYSCLESFLQSTLIKGSSQTIKKYLELISMYTSIYPDILYPKYEELQKKFARSLITESCFESLEDEDELSPDYEIFSPKLDGKFEEAEQLIEELFICESLEITVCILYIRVQIYKARFVAETNKDDSVKILKSCSKKFDVSIESTKPRFLQSYAMIFVELFVLTKDTSYIETAMKYLMFSPHFAAVALWRCGFLRDVSSTLLIKSRLKYYEWISRVSEDDNFLIANIDSIDDETAEIILGLSNIQWNLFASKSLHGPFNWNEWLKDFGEGSFFLSRLKNFQQIFYLNPDGSKCELLQEEVNSIISDIEEVKEHSD